MPQLEDLHSFESLHVSPSFAKISRCTTRSAPHAQPPEKETTIAALLPASGPYHLARDNERVPP
jgi:hypothetical protein